MKIKDEKIIVSNVALWFAKNEKGETVTINDLDEDYNGKYYCPLCGSEVIAKALESEHMSPHFAHHDKSKCKGETIVHWWVKNELLKIGEEFKIITDKHNTYTCKNIEIEKSYKTEFGLYRPDITIETDCGEIIFIEINLSNKKSDDYFDKWEEIGNTVVELNLKDIMYSDKIYINNKFGAIYYKGKRRVIDKNSKNYINYRNSIKDKVKTYDKKIINDLEWFIDCIYESSLFKNNIDYLKIKSGIEIINEMSNKHKCFVEDIYKVSRCGGVLKEYIKQKFDNIPKLYHPCYNEYIHNRFIEPNYSECYKIIDKLFNNNPYIYYQLKCKNISKYYIKENKLDELFSFISSLNSNSEYIENIKYKYNSLLEENMGLGDLQTSDMYDICIKKIESIRLKVKETFDYINCFIQDTKQLNWSDILTIDELDSYIKYNIKIEKALSLLSEYKNLAIQDENIKNIINENYNCFIDNNDIKSVFICGIDEYKIDYIEEKHVRKAIKNMEEIIYSKLEELKQIDIVYNNIKNSIQKISCKSKIELNVNLINKELVTITNSSIKAIYEGDFKIDISRNTIRVNYIKIFNYDINNLSEFEDKLMYCINLSLGIECVILNDEIYRILNKIKNLYQNITEKRYSVTCDLNSFYIWRYNDIIGEYEYSNNTTYDDVLNYFSDVVRLNLYGTK